MQPCLTAGHLNTGELMKCHEGFFQTYCIQCIIILCVAASSVGHVRRAIGCCHCFGQYLLLEASKFGSKSKHSCQWCSLVYTGKDMETESDVILPEIKFI